MISIEEFTKGLEVEFEDLEPGTLRFDTNFRSVKGWSSMHALIIIAYIDANCNALLNGADLKSAQTIQDLYNITIEKLK